jgi:hypothetical protein
MMKNAFFRRTARQRARLLAACAVLIGPTRSSR